MDISAHISNLRKRAGLTQFDLAELIDVSVDSVRRWESNKQFPRADDLVKLASVLHITESELLNGTSDGKVRVTLSYDIDKMKEGEINMDGNGFDLFLGKNGRIGIQGAAMLTSQGAIEEVLADIRKQLELGLEMQIRRGIIQEA